MPDAANTHNELYLVDGNSLVYRAFFALPESIATSTGRPTNAIFGFASMLVKLLCDFGQRPTLVVWDAGSSGRKELYDEYKGHRPRKPDLLAEQYPHMEPLVEAFGYRNVRVDGFEADDVIATVAERARAEGIAVTIVTGDRDALQLVDEEGAVRVLATSRGITDTKVYDHQAVVERYGVPPALIPDLYGLKGDTSDNIPGVPGIGDKTAAQLLQRFGTLEAVLENVDEVSGAKRKENLTVHADDARVSKVLATARRDVPLEIDLQEDLVRAPDRSRLREFFREFELREPLRRLEEALGAEERELPPEAGARTLSARVRDAALSDVARLPGEELTLGVRAPEIPEGQLLAAEERWRWAATGAGEELVRGEADEPEEIVRACGGRPVVVHDAKRLRDVPDPLAHDTLVAAYLLDPAGRAYLLDELVADRGIGTDVEDPAAREAVLTRALAEVQRAMVAERGLEELLHEVELPLVQVLRAMEVAGLKLDVERLREVTDEVLSEAEALEREIHELAGEEFTIGSPQQLGEILFGKLGLTRKRRGKTGFSTDARVLQAIRSEHAIVPRIERWRELNQLAKTYLEPLPSLTDERSRIHTTFSQTTAATGRLSSTNPNLQNIPIRTPLGQRIRRCFRAEEGNVLVSADYSQVELRILAHVAGEEVLKEVFRRGEDVHTATASQVFGKEPAQLTAMDRSKAKMINYGIVYGLSDFGLADRLDIPREEAKAFIDAYLERFAQVKAFMDATIEQAAELGFVTTLFGRRRMVPELRARDWAMRKLGERLAVNTVIQGTAADIIKVAMVRCHSALAEEGLSTRLVLQIHDELLFEGPAGEADRVRELACREMVAAFDMDPPLAVEAGAGPNWMDAK